MPVEHIIFIPAVFFLGFFLGGWFVRRIDQRKPAAGNELSSVSNNPVPTQKGPSGWSLMAALAALISFFIATHLFPLFGGSKAISLVTSGQRLFDQRPSFSDAEVYARLTDFGASGREMYLHFTYTTDVLFPLIFLVFLLLLGRYVSSRVPINNTFRKALWTLPLMWFAADMLENAMVFNLLADYPARNDLLVNGLGVVTVLKFVLLALSIVAPLPCSVLFRKSH